ncbi:MAG: hypothetical protein U0841_11885 [Chloroflexia bacterium]
MIQRLAAIARERDIVALVGEHIAQQSAEMRVIFHDQDAPDHPVSLPHPQPVCA